MFHLGLSAGLFGTKIQRLVRCREFRVAPASYAIWLCIASLCVSLSGCGSADGLGFVTGVVKMDGKPLANASVEFTPIDGKGLTSYGRTDKDGYYYMMASRTAEGSAVGRNRVKISTYEVIDNSRSIPETVPTKYNTSSELEAEVKSGSNTFDFDLSTSGGRVVNRKNDPSNQ
jgi:hypothetical protein